MQVLPLLTPTHFMTNTKKRPRPTTEDFESHYLKKRLISTLVPLDTTEVPPLPDLDAIIEELPEETPTHHSNIQLVNVNGTLLPMEQKPGETKYSIPDFVLKEPSPLPSSSSSRELILYRQNLSPSTQLEETCSVETLDDNNSITSEEFDEEYDPMDID